MNFTSFERRWVEAVLPSFAGAEGWVGEHQGGIDWLRAAEVMLGNATAKARLGLRAGIWIAALTPAWMLGRPQTLDEIPASLRTELIGRMLTHRLYAVRGVATLLKLAASLALMRVASIRVHTHYDLAVAPAR